MCWVPVSFAAAAGQRPEFSRVFAVAAEHGHAETKARARTHGEKLCQKTRKTQSDGGLRSRGTRRCCCQGERGVQRLFRRKRAKNKRCTRRFCCCCCTCARGGSAQPQTANRPPPGAGAGFTHTHGLERGLQEGLWGVQEQNVKLKWCQCRSAARAGPKHEELIWFWLKSLQNHSVLLQREKQMWSSQSFRHLRVKPRVTARVF